MQQTQRRAAGITFSVCAFSLAFSLRAQVNVVTANYGNERTNANLQETVLSTFNVAPKSFGKLGAFPVDGQIYAQPLYVAGVNIPGLGARNVVYVATMNNSLYAIDADAPQSTTPLWSVNFGPPVPSSFLNFHDINPSTGILSTPVIDATKNAIYLVSDTFAAGTPVFQLHALDLSTGREILSGPVAITATVSGDGDASEQGTIALDPVQHLQRPGLLLLNNAVYIAFGSHADQDPYHGWILAYDATNLQHQLNVLNTTPRGGEGSVWQSGRGLAADSDGNIYVGTGNGDYDGTSNFAQSFLKLAPNLTLLDWFAPADWEVLSGEDADVGSLGPMLVPGTNLIVGGDKLDNIYLINQLNMGHLGVEGDAFPQIFQPVYGGGIFNSALWNYDQGPIVYLASVVTSTVAFQIVDGLVNTTPLSQTSVSSDSPYVGMVVSSNGSFPGTGILWMTTGDHSTTGIPGTLHAFDALDLTRELWNSGMEPDRDQLGGFAKFANPLVANGRVYVPTFSNQLTIYGLLPESHVRPPHR
jgi:hypothetical protein